MYRKLIFLLAISLHSFLFYSQNDPKTTELWEPVPTKVTPGENGSAPSDAIVLFNGTDLSNFESMRGEDPKWSVKNGIVTVVPNTGGLKTKQKFGDCQLHIEWRTPEEDLDEGQNKGNSGIFFMERYEVQVLGSFTNKTYPNGQAASIYKQYIPLVNASKKPGEWQFYDIIFTAPRFGKNGSLISHARITVLHNGILAQNNVSLLGPTEYIGMPLYKEHGNKESLILQDHGDLVSFRNIWIREL